MPPFTPYLCGPKMSCLASNMIKGETQVGMDALASFVLVMFMEGFSPTMGTHRVAFFKFVAKK